MAAGFWLGKLDDKQWDRALKDASKLAAERFEQHWQTLLKSTHMKPPPPRDRLRAYRARQTPIWDALRTEFPKQYGEDMDDWHDLEERYGEEIDAEEAERRNAAALAVRPVAAPPPLPLEG